MSFSKPASDEWQSVENYIWNKKQVEEKETNFIYHKEDLVTLRPGREHAWLDSSVEKLLKWLNCGPVEVSFHPDTLKFPVLTALVVVLLQSGLPVPIASYCGRYH